MRDEIDLLRRYVVDGLEHLSSTFRHDNKAIGKKIELLHYSSLLRVRFAQHRMQRRHNRHSHLP